MSNDIALPSCSILARRMVDTALIASGLVALAIPGAAELGLSDWPHWSLAIPPLCFALLGLRWMLWPAAAAIISQRNARMLGFTLLAPMAVFLITTIYKFVTE